MNKLIYFIFYEQFDKKFNEIYEHLRAHKTDKLTGNQYIKLNERAAGVIKKYIYIF